MKLVLAHIYELLLLLPFDASCCHALRFTIYVRICFGGRSDGLCLRFTYSAHRYGKILVWHGLSNRLAAGLRLSAVSPQAWLAEESFRLDRDRHRDPMELRRGGDTNRSTRQWT